MAIKSIIPSLIKTQQAGVELRKASEATLKKVLKMLAEELVAQTSIIIKANKKDLAKQDADNPKNDRLMLNAARVEAIANSILKVRKLPNPNGQQLLEKKLPNGLQLSKVTVPMGVVGVIYESRPNVTFDIAALCLRSQNACVLKGSREAEETNKAAIKIIHKVLQANGLPKHCVLLLPVERVFTTELMKAVNYVDILIPRGSAGLIKFVRENSLVPVIETGAGVCHVYVEQHADLNKAIDIAVNAKVSRPSVCNAADVILIDEKIAKPFLSKLQPALEKFDVEIFADALSYKTLQGYPHLQHAKPEDFDREFMSLKCAVKVVKNIDGALQHIQQHSTKHSEAIVSENKKSCERFIKEVDAAAVYANASTRFTDGEEFGLGAEIGISTQKLHARGPFALEKLVTEKWIVVGDGQVR